MSSTINWVGNRVLDPDVSSRAYQQPEILVPTQPCGAASPTTPTLTQTSSPAETPTLAQTSSPAETPTLMQTPSPAEMSAEMPAQMQMPAPAPTVPEVQQGPPPSSEKGYIPNYLKSNIGKNIRAEFIIGADQFTDRTGVLTEVGINYFVIHDVNSRTDIMCDLYSVKFVTILQG